MEIDNRKSVYCSLKDLKYGWNTEENDFIEVTEWSNGEGWDVHICHNKNERNFSLNYEDLNIINYLTKYLEYNDKK